MIDLDKQFERAQALLKQYFGYDVFRPGQRDIVRSVIGGFDTIGIMPTGGGKSICFQIPALLDDGVTIVVSPLIALMKDQVDGLLGAGVPATFINSSLTAAEVHARMRDTTEGLYRLLYVSPERLDSKSFQAWLNALQPRHFAVDEAHCLSQWGHDFRPSYRNIAAALRNLDVRPAISAFTATATPEVVAEIESLLDLRDPKVFVTGFDRENLHFSVLVGQDKRSFVTRYLNSHPHDAGIIYAATRKEVDGIYEELTRRHIAAGRYHAGLPDDERRQVQEQFLYDEIQVMVATNAFGMGIDKSNVRFVIHASLPRSIEAYYQEAGRAGRDGEPGECILLFSPQDVQTQKFLIEQSAGERQAHEYRKLQTMVDYCHTSLCLRAYLLRYFGESNVDRCGHCSNCDAAFESQDVTLLAQQVFSCVARVKERFGVNVIARILKGSKDKRITELGLHRLSTYGLLKERSEREIVGLIHTFIADGYLRLSDGKYPVVQFQPPAVRVLKQQETVSLRVAKQVEQREADEPLFEKLRSVRMALARQAAVPPYVVFADSTLRDMAAKRPTNRDQMLAVKGVGEVKFEKFGLAFLEALQSDGE